MLAAVNGRGAYGRSARSAMRGLSSAKRLDRARSVMRKAQPKRSDFAQRLRSNGYRRNDDAPPTQRSSSLRGVDMARRAGAMTQRMPSSARRAFQGVSRISSSAGPRTVRTQKRKASSGSKRAGKRLAAFTRAKKAGKSVKAAARAAVRAVPLKTGQTFMGVSSAKRGAKKVAAKKKKRRKARKTKASTPRRKRRKKTTASKPRRKRRKKAAKASAPKRKRRRSKTKAWNYQTPSGKSGGTKPRRKRRKKSKTKAAKAARKRRRAAKAKSSAPRRKRRKSSRRKTRARRKSGGRRKTRRSGKARRSRARRSTRRRGRGGRSRVRVTVRSGGRTSVLTANKRRRGGRKYRRNGLELKKVAKLAALVAVGFVGHKVVTSFACDLAAKFVTPKLPAMQAWEKPICGAVVGLAGIWVSTKVVKDSGNRLAVGSGIVTSWLHTVAITVAKQLGAGGIAERLEGGDSSMAYRLQGFGAQESIMPEYQRIGEYFPAGASGLGEYFSAGTAGIHGSNVGEYFAEGIQGVGAYEKAGPLVLQAASGDVPIDDGIRPDGDLDSVMNLMDSASGLGQGYMQAAAGMGQGYMQAAAGMGQGYMQAAAGMGGGRGYHTSGLGAGIEDVGQQSEWVPNGPLWAGATSVDDTHGETEIPAGILQSAGGSGILG